MSTSASIIVALPNGKFKGIYLHCDGYTSHAGAILKESYNTFEKALELVDGGDLSELGHKIGTKHRFGIDRQYGSCVYYVRDRGDGEEAHAETCMSLSHARLALQMQYNYLFLDGCWYLLPGVGPWREPHFKLDDTYTGS